MIYVTRLNGGQILINENNIQWIESLPDTTITFLGGARVVVKESLADFVRIVEENLRANQAQLQDFDVEIRQ